MVSLPDYVSEHLFRMGQLPKQTFIMCDLSIRHRFSQHENSCRATFAVHPEIGRHRGLTLTYPQEYRGIFSMVSHDYTKDDIPYNVDHTSSVTYLTDYTFQMQFRSFRSPIYFINSFFTYPLVTSDQYTSQLRCVSFATVETIRDAVTALATLLPLCQIIEAYATVRESDLVTFTFRIETK